MLGRFETRATAPEASIGGPRACDAALVGCESPWRWPMRSFFLATAALGLSCAFVGCDAPVDPAKSTVTTPPAVEGKMEPTKPGAPAVDAGKMEPTPATTPAPAVVPEVKVDAPAPATDKDAPKP